MNLQSNQNKQDIWTDKEVEECLKLYYKYGPNWKLISKKMKGKSDKQIMYRITTILKDQKVNSKFFAIAI